MSITQVAAVVMVTKEVLGDRFDGNDVKAIVTKEDRAIIVDRVTEMLASGEAFLASDSAQKFDTPQKLRSYVSGMVTNHFNKCKELNGGSKYAPKNPGSRKNSQDEVLQQLYGLKKVITDAEILVDIEARIQARLIELKPEVTLDVSKLPADLVAAIQAAGVKVG